MWDVRCGALYDDTKQYVVCILLDVLNERRTDFDVYELGKPEYV